MKVLDMINETNIIKAIRISTIFNEDTCTSKTYLFYFPLFNVPKCVILDIVTMLNNLPDRVEHIESPDDMATTLKEYAPKGEIDECNIHLLIDDKCTDDKWTTDTHFLAQELKQELREMED